MSGRRKSSDEDGVLSETTRQLIERLRRGGIHLNTADIDPQELDRLRAVLNERIESGMSGTELGRFVAQLYRGRDQDLGGLISRMSDRQFAYAEIALAVIELTGLSPLSDSLPAEVTRQPILGSNRRFYARSGTPTGVQASSTAVHGLTISERRGGQRPHIGLDPRINSHTAQQHRSPIPVHQPRSIRAPSWPRRVIEAAEAQQAATALVQLQQPHDSPSYISTIRPVRPSVSRDDSGEPPLLRPATIERIVRGSADVDHEARVQEQWDAWEAWDQRARRRAG